MFANDWDDIGENDDHLPLQKRGWHKRLMEREAAAKRFDRMYPEFFHRMGEAAAGAMTDAALRIFCEEKGL